MGKLDTVNNGKGSKPRPIKDLKKYNENWDQIFSKKSKKVLEVPEENTDNDQRYEESNSHSS